MKDEEEAGKVKGRRVRKATERRGRGTSAPVVRKGEVKNEPKA